MCNKNILLAFAALDTMLVFFLYHDPNKCAQNKYILLQNLYNMKIIGRVVQVLK